jgi:hypothetical protein
LFRTNRQPFCENWPGLQELEEVTNQTNREECIRQLVLLGIVPMLTQMPPIIGLRSIMIVCAAWRPESLRDVAPDRSQLPRGRTQSQPSWISRPRTADRSPRAAARSANPVPARILFLGKSYFCLTARTGQGALRNTFSAMLPSTSRASPRWPCVTMTMKSAGSFAPTSAINFRRLAHLVENLPFHLSQTLLRDRGQLLAIEALLAFDALSSKLHYRTNRAGPVAGARSASLDPRTQRILYFWAM